MKTIESLIIIGFNLDSWSWLPFQHTFTAFIEYEIKLSKSVENGSNETITLKIKSTESLDFYLKSLRS